MFLVVQQQFLNSLKKGYKGCYSVVKRYCNKYKVEQYQKATIRFETNPGLQAQVD